MANNSVGSLGKGGASETVEEVHVYDCSFTKTQNGARIKTWKGGSGFARKISFEKIRLIETENPIIIYQRYSNGLQNAVGTTSWRKENKINQMNSCLAVIVCSNPGCKNIVMQKVNMSSSKTGKTTYATCENANGKAEGFVLPSVPCLGKSFS